MVEFPPLCFLVDKNNTGSFMDKAWKLWTDGNNLLQTQIPDNFRPYLELEKEYSKEIKEAKKYMKNSGGNIMLAIDMYLKDNPSAEIAG